MVENKKGDQKRVLVVGAGMAGSEAAWYLAARGVEVILVECKRKKLGPAQKSPHFAELVCTNSLKSTDPASAHGMLKYEMSSLGSLILTCAEQTKVPAGDALSVDREKFSALVTQKLHSHPLIKIIDREVTDPVKSGVEYDCDEIIIASGPLTTSPLEKWIQENLSADDFYFYDAIAPVVDAEGLDYSKLYYKDRHRPVKNDEEGEQADYLNAPLNQQQYENFVEELVAAKKVPPQNFEEYKFFEACLPIDLMAERGRETARFSCMKPIGLELPDGTTPYACVQLRRENLLGSAFNLVGFQTRLTYSEQVRVFKMIPGLENSSFIHLGSVHRNSFLNAKKLLTPFLNSKEFPKISFAGQMTGVEGYTESAACGLYVAYQVERRLKGLDCRTFPVETAMGALVNYLMTVPRPVPSSINFGLLPSIELSKEQRRNRKERKKIKKQLMAKRAQQVFNSFLQVASE